MCGGGRSFSINAPIVFSILFRSISFSAILFLHNRVRGCQAAPGSDSAHQSCHYLSFNSLCNLTQNSNTRFNSFVSFINIDIILLYISKVVSFSSALIVTSSYSIGSPPSLLPSVPLTDMMSFSSMSRESSSGIFPSSKIFATNFVLWEGLLIYPIFVFDKFYIHVLISTRISTTTC